jgi:hypothetical protein
MDLRFSLRDLLLLILIIALATSLWVRQNQMSAKISSLQAATIFNRDLNQQAIEYPPNLHNLPYATNAPQHGEYSNDGPIDNMPIVKPQRRGSVPPVQPMPQDQPVVPAPSR